MPFLPLFPSPKIMLLSRPYLFLYCLEISPFIHIKLYFIGEGKFLLIFLNVPITVQLWFIRRCALVSESKIRTSWTKKQKTKQNNSNNKNKKHQAPNAYPDIF